MTFAAGLCPKIHAGKATEPMVDLRWRGGMQMTNRLIVPSAKSRHFQESNSRCQLDRNAMSGFNSANAFSRNTLKSVRIATGRDTASGTVEVIIWSPYPVWPVGAQAHRGHELSSVPESCPGV